MAQFDDEKQKEDLAALHQQEEEKLAQILSEKYGIRYVDLTLTPINTEALRMLPENEARGAEAAVFEKIAQKLSIAVRSPNKQAAKDLAARFEERGYQVTLYMTSRHSLEQAWERYKELSYTSETKSGVFDISGEEINEITNSITDIKSAAKEMRDISGSKKGHHISRQLEVLLAGALSLGASDAHIEPEEGEVRVRYRLDGVLADVTRIPHETYNLLLSRIKLLSGLKLNIKDEAQDGRFSVHLSGHDIEIRTSVLPGAYGESVVMRLLDPTTIALAMEDLGIEPYLFSILEREIHKPNGLIATTGPTGSGKTTTLYAFLRSIHHPEIKIITIEDPIEYHLPGIVQTQVGEEYTFASGLRSALRQDPDVIMVGEVRDSEVAGTAINAALTGHIVFSTLHTNNAAGTFPRLIDLGVNASIIGSAVNIAIAQRLVRKLCEACKKEVPLKGEMKERVERILAEITRSDVLPEQRETVWHAAGCPECNNLGYRGRIGIFEAILVDKTIEELVKRNPSEREIKEAARPQGILTLEQDGVIKMLRGTTSPEELERVIDFTAADAPRTPQRDGGPR